MDKAAAQECTELLNEIFKACWEGRPDDAQARWERLQEFNSLPEGVQVIPAHIMLARGQKREALQFISSLPDDLCPATRMLCLRNMDDPTWVSVARELENSPNAEIREGARSMLEGAGMC